MELVEGRGEDLDPADVDEDEDPEPGPIGGPIGDEDGALAETESDPGRPRAMKRTNGAPDGSQAPSPASRRVGGADGRSLRELAR